MTHKIDKNIEDLRKKIKEAMTPTSISVAMNEPSYLDLRSKQLLKQAEEYTEFLLNPVMNIVEKALNQVREDTLKEVEEKMREVEDFADADTSKARGVRHGMWLLKQVLRK